MTIRSRREMTTLPSPTMFLRFIASRITENDPPRLPRRYGISETALRERILRQRHLARLEKLTRSTIEETARFVLTSKMVHTLQVDGDLIETRRGSI